MFFCFFFKQKTAYEMRISDWSSDVCSSDIDLGKGLGFWNTMPTRARSCTTSIDEAYISSASSVISPSTRALATVSFMRFKVRRKVDLPQPDGPMKAEIGRANVCTPVPNPHLLWRLLLEKKKHSTHD